MARRIYSEDLVLNLIINGKDMPAQNKMALNELYKIDRATRQLEIDLAKVEVAQRKLGKQTTKNAKEFKALENQAKKLRAEISQNHAKMNELRQSIGRAGLTINQLNSYLKILNIQLANTSDRGALARLRKEIILTENRIKQLRTGASRLSIAFERMGTVANKFGTITSWLAILGYAFGRAVGGTVKVLRELDKEFSNVMKSTGLTRQEMWALKKQFDQVNLDEAMKTPTATKDLLEIARIAGRLGVRGVKDIADFTMAVDKLYVALGEDLEGSVEDVAEKIGKLVNTFRLTDNMELGEAMLRAGSLINELSKSSAAGAETILNYTSRLGGVGSMAQFTMDQLAGLGAALDAVGVPAERGSTALAKLIIGMGEHADEFARSLGMTTDEYRKAMETDINGTMLQLAKASAQGNASILDVVAGMDKLDISGVRVMEVYGKLVQNMDMVIEQQAIARTAFSSSASVMNEFYIMSKDFDSLMAIQGKRWKALGDSYAKTVAPGVYKMYKAFTNLAYAIKDGIGWIREHIKWLYVLLGWVVAFKSSAIVQMFVSWGVALKVWGIELWRSTKAAIWNNMVVAKMKVAYWEAGMGVKGLTAALKSLWASMLSNPFTAIIALVGLAASAFFLFRKRTDEVTDAIRRSNTEIEKQSSAMTELFKTVMNVNEGTTQRKEGIEKINMLYGEYLDNLISDTANNDDLSKAMDNANKKLKEKLYLQMQETEMSDITEKKQKTIWRGIEALTEKSKKESYTLSLIRSNIESMFDEMMEFGDSSGEITQKQIEAIQAYLREVGVEAVRAEADLIKQIYNVRLNVEKATADFRAKVAGYSAGKRESGVKKMGEAETGWLPIKSDTELEDEGKRIETWYKQQLTKNQEYANQNKLSKEKLDKENQKTELEYVNKQIEIEKDRYTRIGYETVNGKKKIIESDIKYDEEALKQSEKYNDLMLERAKLMGGRGKTEKDKEIKAVDIAALRAKALKEGREKDEAEEKVRYENALKDYELTEDERTAYAKKSADERATIDKNRKDAAEIEKQVHETNLVEIHLKYLDKELADDNVTYAQKMLLLEAECQNELITEEEYAERRKALTDDYEKSMLAYKQKYGVLVEETLDNEIAMFEKSEFYALLTEEEKQKGIEAIRKKYEDKRERTFKDNIQKEFDEIKAGFNDLQMETLAQGEALINIWQNVGQGIGEAFSQLFDSSQKGFSAFAKTIILTTIDMAANMARAMYPVILARQIAKNVLIPFLPFPAAMARALSQTALAVAAIEAGFGVARAAVSTLWKTEKPKKTEQYAKGNFPVDQIRKFYSPGERKSPGERIGQYAGGTYPVTGADDGRTYDAQYVGRVRTGVYRKPSLGLFAERPEMVIDYPTLRRIQFNNPALIDAILAHRREPLPPPSPKGAGAKQFAKGNYDVKGMEHGAKSMGIDGDAAKELTAAINRLMTWKPKVYTEMIKKDLETMDRIDKNSRL